MSYERSPVGYTGSWVPVSSVTGVALSHSSDEVRGIAVLALAGRLCASSIFMIEPEVARLLAGDRTVPVFDLAGISDCDAAGVAILDACDRACATAGVELRMAAPPRSLYTALRARGLASRLSVSTPWTARPAAMPRIDCRRRCHRAGDLPAAPTTPAARQGMLGAACSARHV
jgi:ABC-type transporter Mla MlaB component